MRQKNSNIPILIAALILCSPLSSIGSGNPFLGKQSNPQKEQTTNTVVKPSVVPMPSSIPPPQPWQQPPRLEAKKQDEAKKTPWAILGKMGEDQIALQNTQTDEVMIVPDGTNAGECYVLYPEVLCDQATIAKAQSRKSAAMDTTRLKTELKMERIKIATSAKQTALLQKEITTAKQALEAEQKKREKALAEMQNTLSATYQKQKSSDAGTIQKLMNEIETHKKNITKLEQHKQQLQTETTQTKQQLQTATTQIKQLQSDNHANLQKYDGEIKELKNAPPITKTISIPIYPPEWLASDYFDASIKNTTVGYRRQTNGDAVVRIATEDWNKKISKLPGINKLKQWSDQTYTYLHVKHGGFSLVLPAEKFGGNNVK